MCGISCPCSDEYASTWTSLTEEELNTYGRTGDAPPTVGDAGFTVNTNGDLVYFMYFIAQD